MYINEDKILERKEKKKKTRGFVPSQSLKRERLLKTRTRPFILVNDDTRKRRCIRRFGIGKRTGLIVKEKLLAYLGTVKKNKSLAILSLLNS